MKVTLPVIVASVAAAEATALLVRVATGDPQLLLVSRAMHALLLLVVVTLELFVDERTAESAGERGRRRGRRGSNSRSSSRWRRSTLLHNDNRGQPRRLRP